MAKKSIFIIGNSRSGTTLMANILGRNKYIFSFHELHFFENIWTKKNDRISKEKAEKILHKLFCSQRVHPFFKCEKDRFKKDIDFLLRNKKGEFSALKLYSDFLFFETKNNGKEIPCEHTPRNLFYLDTILNFFPEARVIYMIRDPRDSLLSQKFKWKRYYKSEDKLYPFREAVRSFINYHPFTLSLLWRSCANYMQNFADNSSVKTVKFEELIENPENVVKEICFFIGIDFSKVMLNVPIAFSSIYDDSENKRGFDKRRTGNWKKKLNSAEVFIIQKINKEFMEGYGYKIKSVFPNPFWLIYYFLIFIPKTMLVFLFNVSRNKNIFYSAYKRLKGLFR